MQLKRRKKKELIPLKTQDIQEIRKDQWEQQNRICPLLGISIAFENTALDHKHKRKRDKAGEDGGGLCRGVVQIQANVFEGKVSRSYKRLGLEKYISLPALLRNLADYIENPPMEQIFIHPSEVKKDPYLSTRSFGELQKAYKLKYPKRNKLLYPKKRRITKRLAKLFIEFNITPNFLKN